MNYRRIFKRVRRLEFDKEMLVCQVEGTELYILRPSKLSKRFKNYDPKKNFQIWLRQGSRNFRPNHLRMFIDLHLRVRSRPDLKRKLLEIFDGIFYGEDPDKIIKPILDAKFEHFLNPLLIIANLSQLFIIEQAYAYYRKSNYEPLTLFYQGWVRQALDDIKEVDNLCMSIAKGQPPAAKYTSKENKKHKKYQKNLPPLWYLSDEEKGSTLF